jgi:four helix bundle protein
MTESGYTKLEVWERSMDFVVKLYEATQSFPKEEVYALTNQIRRAAVSIPSNIVEGRSKRGTKEFMHFINIASGSAAELDTQIQLAKRLVYLKPEKANGLLEELAVIARMLNKLYSSLEHKISDRVSPQPLASSL